MLKEQLFIFLNKDGGDENTAVTQKHPKRVFIYIPVLNFFSLMLGLNMFSWPLYHFRSQEKNLTNETHNIMTTDIKTQRHFVLINNTWWAMVSYSFTFHWPSSKWPHGHENIWTQITETRKSYISEERECCFIKGFFLYAEAWPEHIYVYMRCVFIVVVLIDTHSHISRDVEGRSPPGSSGHAFSFCSNLDPGKTSAPDTQTHI